MDFRQWLEEFEPKILYVVRGLPRSGKTTRANELLTKKGGSPDHIFNTKEPDIQQRKGLFSGHTSNFQAFKYAIDNGYTPIILDNDHLQWGDMSAYVRYAHKAEYEIKLEEPTWKVWGKNRDSLKKKDEKPPDKLADDLRDNGVSKATVLSAIKRWQEIRLKEKLEPKVKKK